METKGFSESDALIIFGKGRPVKLEAGRGLSQAALEVFSPRHWCGTDAGRTGGRRAGSTPVACACACGSDDVFMAMELIPGYFGSVSGTVYYHPAFRRL